MAKTDHCPICNVAVKPENLLRHLNDTHPRHPDTPRWRDQLKSEPGRVAPTRTSSPIRVRPWQVAIVAAIVLGGVGLYYLTQINLFPSQPFPCVSGTLVYHWHTQLYVYSGGALVTIPGGIGLFAGCAEPLHTHDTTGTIHVETDVSRFYAIGDFYRVWNKPFGSPTQMIVNGTALPSPTASQILYDQETISIYYTTFA